MKSKKSGILVKGYMDWNVEKALYIKTKIPKKLQKEFMKETECETPFKWKYGRKGLKTSTFRLFRLAKILNDCVKMAKKMGYDEFSDVGVTATAANNYPVFLDVSHLKYSDCMYDYFDKKDDLFGFVLAPMKVKFMKKLKCRRNKK